MFKKRRITQTKQVRPCAVAQAAAAAVTHQRMPANGRRVARHATAAGESSSPRRLGLMEVRRGRGRVLARSVNTPDPKLGLARRDGGGRKLHRGRSGSCIRGGSSRCCRGDPVHETIRRRHLRKK